MVTSKSPSVTVLWDLETCLPGDTFAGDAASVVAKVAATHGNIRTFKAFYLSSSAGRAPTTSDLQGLQMKGVDPVDCAFLTGDSIEKVMTIEMFTDVIDGGYHSPPVIVIVSPRSSLEYAAEKLRHKNLKVLVFKSWNEIREESDKVVEVPAIQLHGAVASSASTDLTPETDPMLAMSHLDRHTQRRFHVLIEALWESMGKGEPRVSRADIGNMLIRRNANVYQDAQFGGKSAFKSYIATAEEKGVITSGGGGSEAWVELRTSSAGNLAPGMAN
ncbi:hypothetical protein NMY22_g17350 [Coprinellus aureogranulatus]|nr:hypothetical protein NMY22_g17350 [Coprinellus aureogranulatus]